DPCIIVDGKSDFHFALNGKTYQLLQKYFSTLLPKIVSPFYLFQDFTLVLWLAQGYLEYAIAILLLTGLSIGLTVYDRRQGKVSQWPRPPCPTRTTLCPGGNTVGKITGGTSSSAARRSSRRGGQATVRPERLSCKREPVGDTVAMALLLMTIAIPPAIPAALTTGVVYAQGRLKKKKVFCISPQRINIFGPPCLVKWQPRPLTEPPAGPLGGQSVSQSVSLAMPLLSRRWPAGGPVYFSLAPFFPPPPQAPLEGMAILRQFPFSSSLLRMSVIVQELGKEKDVYHLCMKGAPEVVASFCQPMTALQRLLWANNSSAHVPLTGRSSSPVPPNFQAELRSFTSQGFRVIALAHKEQLPLERGVSLDSLER
ncbi:hypothetical protein JD844_014005, partial [Phrynosoma platyrhinos]